MSFGNNIIRPLDNLNQGVGSKTKVSVTGGVKIHERNQ